MADDNDTMDGSDPGRGGRARQGRIRPTGRRRKVPSTRRRVLRGTAWAAAAVVALAGSGLGYAYFKLNGNISGVDIDAALGKHRPKAPRDGAMNILVMGSDSRAGTHGEYGKDQGGARSDTAMVVHVNKTHDKASVVSIPRDTIVDRPDCPKQGDPSRTVPGEHAMFNSAYQTGGPACAVKTVESMSGMRMNHFTEVDFKGFKKLIDTLGGVDVTTTKPIHDPNSHLDLPAGKHRLNGEQSLGLVRTRHGVGDGSDLGRIQLQQAFVKALMKQVNQVGVFSSPKKLYDLADTATSALTTDSDLDSVGKLSDLAKTLKGVKPENVNMTTLPVRYDPKDPNRVVPIDSRTQQVWSALKHDREVPKSATKGSAGDQGDSGVVR